LVLLRAFRFIVIFVLKIVFLPGIGVAEVNRRNLMPSTLPCARTPAAA
jgi:hypothetical protein